MPSQPLAPTFRENSGTSVSSRLGLNGEKVPAAISSARKARTSLRSCWQCSGRRIGSKRRAAVIVVLFSESCAGSAGGDERPQFIGAARRDALAELHRPIALRAEIVAPGQCAQRIAMQDVLDGEADRAMDLVGDGAALFGGLRAADLGGDGFEVD